MIETKNLQIEGKEIEEKEANAYWRDNKRVLYTLLSVWLFVTFGCGLVLGDWLDQFSIMGFPLGFWFTQQGAMLVYISLIFIYHFWMKRIEHRHGIDDVTDAVIADAQEKSL